MAEGEKAPIKKLASMADNMTELISLSTVLILSVETPKKASSLDRIIEGIKDLEVRMTSVERKGTKGRYHAQIAKVTPRVLAKNPCIA